MVSDTNKGLDLEVWAIGSGWTNHMTSNKIVFVNPRSIQPMSIHIANGKSVPTTGKGDISVKLASVNGPVTIHGVYYALGLYSGVSLLSTAQLAERGITTTFLQNNVEVEVSEQDHSKRQRRRTSICSTDSEQRRYRNCPNNFDSTTS